jgi:hypothetical protein
MAYLLGTDEAGYGPNLGPLVISATLWQAPGDPCEVDLYELLADIVASCPSRENTTLNRLVLGDSKVLYDPKSGVSLLERGLLAALGAMNATPQSWREIFSLLAPETDGNLDALPWHVGFDLPLPVAALADDVAEVSSLFRAGLSNCGVRLVAIRSRVVFPAEFNEFVDQYGSKGAALSRLTLELAGRVLSSRETETRDEPVLVFCDKHGGRNLYGSLLYETLAESLVEVVSEGRSESIYRWGPPRQRSEIRFCTQAERFLPVALASMTSKYLRELAMRAFNDYWCGQVPGLRPTAGYPQDARRFQEEITTAQTALGIDSRVLWRVR